MAKFSEGEQAQVEGLYRFLELDSGHPAFAPFISFRDKDEVYIDGRLTLEGLKQIVAVMESFRD